MSNWTDVCALDDINLDTGVCALVDNQQVAIFRPALGDTIFAVGNFDPIGEANVLSRGLICDIKGRLTVASPLYKQHYCLRSGECLEDDSVRIPTFKSKIENARIYVSI